MAIYPQISALFPEPALWAAHFALLVFHTLLTLFNALGWLIPTWRRVHLLVILMTAFAWFIMGQWYGIGYCPLTDWHWEVLRALGKHDLPPGFIEYVIMLFPGVEVSSRMVYLGTAWGFGIALSASLLLNGWWLWRKTKQPKHR